MPLAKGVTGKHIASPADLTPPSTSCTGGRLYTFCASQPWQIGRDREVCQNLPSQARPAQGGLFFSLFLTPMVSPAAE